MPYTKTNYPDQLKNLKEAARNKWIEVFNTVYSENKDEDISRQAAWKVVGDMWSNKTYLKKI